MVEVERTICRKRSLSSASYAWHRMWVVVYTSGLLDWRPVSPLSFHASNLDDDDDPDDAGSINQDEPVLRRRDSLRAVAVAESLAQSPGNVYW